MKASERIKIIPNKRQGFTHGTKKFRIKFTNWNCHLELTLLNGTKRIVKAINFMDAYKTKKEAVAKAVEYSEYMLSRGDFYFV